jgi:hypothetical protein
MKKWKRSPYVDAAAIALLVILLAAVNYGFIRRHSTVKANNAATLARVPHNDGVARILAKANPAAAPVPVPASFRPLNFALLRGGFTSADEFFARVSEDPILHSFYGDCADRHASMHPLSEDVRVFTAFRRGNQIRWAQRPLLVHKGEYVMTFCGKTVLARCGNLISMAAMEPSEDIPPGLLETPTDPIEPPLSYAAEPSDSVVIPVTATAPAAARSRFFFFVPPLYIPTGGSHSVPPPRFSSPPPVTVVPPPTNAPPSEPPPPPMAPPPPPTHVSGDEFSGHQASFTLLLGLTLIALVKLFTR